MTNTRQAGALGLAAALALCLPVALATGRAHPAMLTLDACHSGPAPADRYATFSAAMSRVDGASGMSVRFELLERTPGSAVFRPVAAPGLGVWRPAAVGVAAFRYSQQVSHLAGPAAFRVAVRFRWLGPGQAVVASAFRRSAVCEQPDWRSHLLVGAIKRQQYGAATDYDVTVVNAGRAPSGPITVGLTVGEVTLPPQRRPGLAPGGLGVVRFAGGPACPAGGVLRVSISAPGRGQPPAGPQRTLAC